MQCSEWFAGPFRAFLLQLYLRERLLLQAVPAEEVGLVAPLLQLPPQVQQPVLVAHSWPVLLVPARVG